MASRPSPTAFSRDDQNTVASRDMVEQVLDSMDIERERGITIKSQAVCVLYEADNGETSQFNLIVRRVTSISPTRSRARWRHAGARFSWIPPRVSRRRRSPMPCSP